MTARGYWLLITAAAVSLVLGWQLAARGAPALTTPASQPPAACASGTNFSNATAGFAWGPICVADLDGNGKQEIIFVPWVFPQRLVIINNDGRVRATVKLQ
jgi:hypothetical protein